MRGARRSRRSPGNSRRRRRKESEMMIAVVGFMSLVVAGLIQSAENHSSMSAEMFIAALYVFALAAFLGYQVISRVPPLLHTPLMSATNAISAISVVGAIVTAGGNYNTTSTILGFIAVTSATINVVGGFMI